MFIALIILTAPQIFRGQTVKCPKLPDKYKWESGKEYKRDEELVLRTLQWLTVTPLSSDILLRGKANLFVMEWICGSPRIEIRIDSDILPFYIDYPDLLFPYIHGIARCKLGKKTDCSELQAMISGFECVAYMIQTDEELKRAKQLQPIVKAYKKNKLEPFVESLMKNKTEK
jgi:hypothetical protein